MSKFNFLGILSQWDRTKKQALQEMAEVSRDFFVRAFNKQGWNGKKWKEVQRRTPGTVSYRRATGTSKTRPILEGEWGYLQIAVKESIKRVTVDKAVLIVDLPYAAIQNEGGTNGEGAYIPARQFVGQTQELTEKQLEILKQVTGRVWNTK